LRDTPYFSALGLAVHHLDKFLEIHDLLPFPVIRVGSLRSLRSFLLACAAGIDAMRTAKSLTGSLI
jgi:hypothetical protein